MIVSDLVIFLLLEFDKTRKATAVTEKLAAKKDDSDEIEDMFLEEWTDDDDDDKDEAEKNPFRLGDDTDSGKEKILDTDEPDEAAEQLVWRCKEIWKHYVPRLDNDISRLKSGLFMFA